MINGIKKKSHLALLLLTLLLSFSCSRFLGYGVLLWSSEDPPVPSGTVLPVYIRSNIDKVWVVGIPKEYRDAESSMDKFELPLAKLEMSGSKKKALERAQAFSPYALIYAETLQDGLPIRDNPDNGARRVYRLKLGEIIKILSPARGTVAVGASGDALPGEWYQVLTEDGTTGYCFSYRLKLFDHLGGPLAAVRNEQTETADPVLDRLLSRTWSPESYGTMIASRRLDLEELSRRWSFDPGDETGIARIRIRELDRSFTYTRIRSTGSQSWQFEGTPLQMNLRSDTTLAVQFTESNGILRTILFVALSSKVDDIILQESARRDESFKTIFTQGPVYTSNNYGAITFREDRHFNWTGYMLLVPQIIPASALGSGSISMRLYLSPALNELYTGAFTMYFDGAGGSGLSADFMYNLDSHGLRLEYVPQTSLDNITVVRRASSPLIIFFFRNENQDSRPVPDYSAPFTAPPSSGSQGFNDDYYENDPFSGGLPNLFGNRPDDSSDFWD